MAEKLAFKVGGVPEHFNVPWYNAYKQSLFEGENFSIKWRDYPGGTGAMAKALREAELDIAVLLTEGIIADIAKGNPSSIISMYVSSPLIWGIHVPAHSALQNINDIKDKKYAISRLGSGSHLMAYVNASQRGWAMNENQLVIVGDMEGARKAFKENLAEVFMWEKFMTQPLVSQGEFRRIGECPTPWPCFVIAARQEIINKYPVELKKLISIIEKESIRFKQGGPASVKIIAENYGLKTEDAKEWFSNTEFACGKMLPDRIAQNVVATLKDLNLIDTQAIASGFVASLD